MESPGCSVSHTWNKAGSAPGRPGLIVLPVGSVPSVGMRVWAWVVHFFSSSHLTHSSAQSRSGKTPCHGGMCSSVPGQVGQTAWVPSHIHMDSNSNPSLAQHLYSVNCSFSFFLKIGMGTNNIPPLRVL